MAENFNPAPKAVRIWLIIGLFMVIMQVVIGGVTRLTGSGLSITKWEVVTGTFPPLTADAWDSEFDKYKATPQYEKINRGMSLSEFKFIYFWEYFHRLWARLMFFVFVFPFAIFLWRKMLTPVLRKRLLVVVALAGLEGFFGWIMVASGLRERPWVNAYNLTLHLCMGILIFGYLLWTTFIAYRPGPSSWEHPRYRKFGWMLLGISFLQIALGAMMSGMKAGLFFPTWPAMDGGFMPGILLDGSQWKGEVFVDYDKNPFMPALIQVLHRNTAYILTGLIVYFFIKTRPLGNVLFKRSLWVLLAVLFLQVLLGILTLVNCVGHIPVALGVFHQAGALLLFAVLLYVLYQMRPNLGS